MTKRELNRDIKRLANRVKMLGGINYPSDKYDTEVEEIKKEYRRLYYADTTFNSYNTFSILVMIRLNVRYRIIPFHQFGLMIDVLEK